MLLFLLLVFEFQHGNQSPKIVSARNTTRKDKKICGVCMCATISIPSLSIFHPTLTHLATIEPCLFACGWTPPSTSLIFTGHLVHIPLLSGPTFLHYTHTPPLTSPPVHLHNSHYIAYIPIYPVHRQSVMHTFCELIVNPPPYTSFPVSLHRHSCIA